VEGQTLCFADQINRHAIRRHLVKPELSATAGISLRKPRADQGILMKSLFARFAEDESAATAIEYGLIAAGISVAIITVVNGIGTNLNTKFSAVSTQLK
jgi:pilus assembly protein Flp/PilA